MMVKVEKQKTTKNYVHYKTPPGSATIMNFYVPFGQFPEGVEPPDTIDIPVPLGRSRVGPVVLAGDVPEPRSRDRADEG